MTRNRATTGKVRLSIWIDAPLLDYVRAHAKEAKMPANEWAGEALRRAVLSASLGALRFPQDESSRALPEVRATAMREAEKDPLPEVRGLGASSPKAWQPGSRL